MLFSYLIRNNYQRSNEDTYLSTLITILFW